MSTSHRADRTRRMLCEGLLKEVGKRDQFRYCDYCVKGLAACKYLKSCGCKLPIITALGAYVVCFQSNSIFPSWTSLVRTPASRSGLLLNVPAQRFGPVNVLGCYETANHRRRKRQRHSPRGLVAPFGPYLDLTRRTGGDRTGTVRNVKSMI